MGEKNSGRSTGQRYVMPTTAGARRTLRLTNGTVAWLTAHGVSLAGSRILAVRGRTRLARARNTLSGANNSAS